MANVDIAVGFNLQMTSDLDEAISVLRGDSAIKVDGLTPSQFFGNADLVEAFGEVLQGFRG